MPAHVVCLAAGFVLAMLPAMPPAKAAAGAELVQATMGGDLARVTRLIRADAPLDEQDTAGRTALLIAVDLDLVAIARALIAAGASINAQAANLDTPWLLAGAQGRTEIIRDMIPRNPDLSIRNRYGGNALIPACERAHVETIKLLLTTKISRP